MSLKFALPVALATACLSFATTSQALNYAETGDAGDLPTAAQVISGPAGTSLDQISGALTLTNGISDSDLFEILISNPSAFSAAATAFAPGVNNFDSQIFLFSATTNKGIVGNDDNPANGAPQAAIPAGSFTGAAGLYYILISGSGRYATSAGGLIFPNFTDGTTDPSTVVGPTGPGGAGAITGYTGNSNEGGNYRIALTGAQFVVVPEPASLVYVIAGAAGLMLVTRRARGSSAR